MSSEIDFKIQVRDSNNHVPVVLAPPTGRIDENSPLGTFVANVSFLDDDPCWVNKMGEIRVVGDFAENFRIENHMLTIGSKKLDFEDLGSNIIIKIKVEDRK